MKIPKKHNPFTTPNTYFEEFTKNLKTRLNVEEPNLPKEAGFKLPKDYFDRLPVEINKNLASTESKVIQLKTKKLYYMAAASVAAVLLLFFGLNWNKSQETSWKNIANTDIENYFDTHGLGLSSYEIAEVISVDDLELTDFLETDLNEEHIVEYLNEHTDDFEELNLEDNE